MADMIDSAAGVEALVEAPVSRRAFFAGVGAASAAGAVMVALPAAAAALGGTRAYEGAFALGGRGLVHGYFVTPRGKTELDVVVIVPGEGKTASDAKALARRHAAAGRLAVVPDLAATYGASVLGGRAAMTSALMADKARYRRFPHGTARVSYVTA